MTFIICEVGSNWTSFEDAKDSITMAKNCGADAVKFQMFSVNELYGLRGHYGYADTDVTHDPIKEWLPKLKEKADACGIEFMCTAFSPEGLRYLDPYVKRHKIASSDLSYPELLRTAAETGKPIFLSTGGCSLGDIDCALNVLGDSSVVPLYCVSNYPAKNVNLFSLDVLSKHVDRPVGYSCHTTDWYTPVSAVKHHSAVVIEKHFKLRDMDTPDSAHSLLPDDFKRMVDSIRGEVRCSFPDPQELEFRLKHKRRLVAITDIKKGEKLVYNIQYGVYRSLVEDYDGLTGFAVDVVNGKLASKDIKAGEPIGPNSFS